MSGAGSALAGAGHVRLEVVPPVARLVLARPERRNAVSQAMLASMMAMLGELALDESVRALVLRGDGPDFCAGEDVRGFDFPDAEASTSFLDGPLRFFAALETLPKPVVVAVHGHALGFGAEVLFACDAVLADPAAVFGFAEIDHGAVPSVLMTRGLGSVFRRRALSLALTGRRVGAAEARDLHIVHEVVDDVQGAADRLAVELAARPPAAVRVVKTMLGADAPDDHAAAREFMGRVLVQVRPAL
jgi:enoyl-CoA hydratase/carnithine racemase